MMGILVNVPVALAPGMGLNGYFSVIAGRVSCTSRRAKTLAPSHPPPRVGDLIAAQPLIVPVLLSLWLNAAAPPFFPAATAMLGRHLQRRHVRLDGSGAPR